MCLSRKRFLISPPGTCAGTRAQAMRKPEERNESGLFWGVLWVCWSCIGQKRGMHLGHAGARAVVGGLARVREGVRDERQLERQKGEGAEAHRDLAKVEGRVEAPVVP